MFKTTKKINFYDCDPAGILFYGRVYELCHSAYEDLISGFELKEDYWNNNEYVVPVLNSEAHYHKPVKYGETVQIEIRVSRLKSSSFELNYTIKNAEGGECVEVRTVHVFVNKTTWKKMEMKPEIKKGFEKYFKAV